MKHLFIISLAIATALNGRLAMPARSLAAAVKADADKADADKAAANKAAANKSAAARAAASPALPGRTDLQRSTTADWPVYGGDPSADHYSKLAQINRSNVEKLKEAWRFNTAEPGRGLQTNPLIVGRTLFAYTPSQKVIALDAATGKLLWKFDSGVAGSQPVRGMAYWSDEQDPAKGHGAANANANGGRLLAGIMNFLYALDARTGKPIASFGEEGRIDLRKGLGGDYLKQSIALTSPGIIYKDLIVVGGRNPETPPAPPGDIRAFDVRTGALRWRFRTIPHPGEPGYETWPKDAWKTAGAANNWAGMSLDQARGIVYVPTGSAVPDFFGGERIGDNLFADTLLALDAASGKLIWYFQGVHHDIWDRDFPAAPVLMTIKHDGKSVDVVAQTTKQGFLFVLDRSTGKSIFPIEERKVPVSTVSGEVSSPTQPFPTLPAAYTLQSLTEADITDRTPEAHAWSLKEFRTFKSAGQFFPLSVGVQTVVAPGFDGGAEWGGPGADPEKGILYINANNIVYTGGLEENNASAGLGTRTYKNQCSLCHGENLAGSPPDFPSLIDIGNRLTSAEIATTIHQGKGRMPSFPNLQDDAVSALLQYLRNGKDALVAGSSPDRNNAHAEHAEAPQQSASGAAGDAEVQMRYNFTGYKKFYDPDGYPANKPPWGTLSAIDLNTGKYLWQVPLGSYPRLTASGLPHTGSENYGGPVVTAGGLLFIGATAFDHKFRAFDSDSGKLLWEAMLPVAGLATPSTYMVDGKQFIVTAAGGGKDPALIENAYYIAFALP